MVMKTKAGLLTMVVAAFLSVSPLRSQDSPLGEKDLKDPETQILKILGWLEPSIEDKDVKAFIEAVRGHEHFCGVMDLTKYKAAGAYDPMTRTIFLDDSILKGALSLSDGKIEVAAPQLAPAYAHEVGHGVVQAPHHKPAYWVNVRTGQSLALGPHCTEPNCLMYESVDIRAPPREEGHLLLGGEKRHDAGLDDFLERRLPDWLCHLCMPFVDVNESYM